MLTYFRKIRQRFIESGAVSRYFVYAMGEILLVVIGILLALQINNKNEDRLNRNRELKLLIELHSNLLDNKAQLEADTSLEQIYYNACKMVLQHLNQRIPYHDSLDEYFRDSQFSADIVLNAAAYEAIKSNGFDIIRNDSLRTAIIELYDNSYALMVRNTVDLEDQYWPALVVPLFTKHFRSVTIEMERAPLKPVDYQNLLDDQQFAAMLEMRAQFRLGAKRLKTECISETAELIRLVEDEINRD